MSAFQKTAETYAQGARTLPGRYFTSPEIYALENERIFGPHWLCVGHQSQISDPGDYFVQEVAGESLVILRDRGGALRCFYNVCRHRGTRLCEEKSGQLCETIQCPYHGWTYTLEGRLIGAPHMERVNDFTRGDYSLSQVRLALWEGFIFVNFSEASPSIETAFAPLAGKFTPWKLGELRSVKRIDYEVRANWKLILQNYSECYHCPLVHPTLSKLTPYDSAENDLCEGPFLGGFMPIKKGESLTMSGKACASAIVPSEGREHQRVFYYSIFPNMLLSMHPDYVMAHQIWPRSAERVVIFCDWFFHPKAFARADFRPDDAIDFWHMTNLQDWHVCELSQQGLASRAYQPGPYSPRESIPAAWDREYLRALGAEAAANPGASLLF